MMKLYKSALLAILTLTGSLAMAQSSFTISNESPGVFVDAEVEFPLPPATQTVEFHADITNTGQNPVTLRVFRETLSEAAGHDNNFCIGPICYPPFVDTSAVADSVYMVPGHVESTFIGHLQPHEVTGVTVAKYCMFDYHNPSDSTCFIVTYNITPVGIRESSSITAQLGDVYPNPANSIASFAYMIEGTPTTKEYLVHDLVGNLVSENLLDDFQGVQEVSIEDLNAGVYIISIRLDGAIVGTKRLVVER